MLGAWADMNVMDDERLQDTWTESPLQNILSAEADPSNIYSQWTQPVIWACISYSQRQYAQNAQN